MLSARMVHVSRLVPHPDNARTGLGDPDKLAELTASVAEHGVLQPLLAESRGDGTFTVLAGHRRLAAAKRARLEMVPAVIQPAGQGGHHLEIMLVENCQRENLSGVEKARAMGVLRDEHGYTGAAIAKATGLSQSTVSYYLSLLDLDEESLARVQEGTVTAAAARTAVKQARQVRRGSAQRPGRPVRSEPAWLNARHRLAPEARVLCDHRHHPMVGGVACGQCWEKVIRHDDRGRRGVALAQVAAG